MLSMMALDGDRVERLLQTLDPLQEKVMRLYLGWGCRRCHSLSEIAHEFQVSPQVIGEIVSVSERQLARAGLEQADIRAAAGMNPLVAPHHPLRCRHKL